MSYAVLIALLENLDQIEQKYVRLIIHLVQQLMPRAQIARRKDQNAQVCLIPYFVLLCH